MIVACLMNLASLSSSSDVRACVGTKNTDHRIFWMNVTMLAQTLDPLRPTTHVADKRSWLIRKGLR